MADDNIVYICDSDHESEAAVGDLKTAPIFTKRPRALLPPLIHDTRVPKRRAKSSSASKSAAATSTTTAVPADDADDGITAITVLPRDGGGRDLCHLEWEALDPAPNVFVLFRLFDELFFDGILGAHGVEVKWSRRMTLCAGLCRYEARGGACCISLSEPLLKLRPRSDLVNTLLHEAIHALLFITDLNRDRTGHGPKFHAHARRINDAACTHITEFHSFHDEVDSFRKHVWRCSGPCAQRPPYFGYLKRAMNRAPGPTDPWWAEHRLSCGGLYTKVAGPPLNNSTGKGSGPSHATRGLSIASKNTATKPLSLPGSHEVGAISEAKPFSGAKGTESGSAAKPNVLESWLAEKPSRSRVSIDGITSNPLRSGTMSVDHKADSFVKNPTSGGGDTQSSRALVMNGARSHESIAAARRALLAAAADNRRLSCETFTMGIRGPREATSLLVPPRSPSLPQQDENATGLFNSSALMRPAVALGGTFVRDSKSGGRSLSTAVDGTSSLVLRREQVDACDACEDDGSYGIVCDGEGHHIDGRCDECLDRNDDDADSVDLDALMLMYEGIGTT